MCVGSLAPPPAHDWRSWPSAHCLPAHGLILGSQLLWLSHLDGHLSLRTFRFFQGSWFCLNLSPSRHLVSQRWPSTILLLRWPFSTPPSTLNPPPQRYIMLALYPAAPSQGILGKRASLHVILGCLAPRLSLVSGLFAQCSAWPLLRLALWILEHSSDFIPECYWHCCPIVISSWITRGTVAKAPIQLKLATWSVDKEHFCWLLGDSWLLA